MENGISTKNMHVKHKGQGERLWSRKGKAEPPGTVLDPSQGSREEVPSSSTSLSSSPSRLRWGMERVIISQRVSPNANMSALSVMEPSSSRASLGFQGSVPT